MGKNWRDISGNDRVFTRLRAVLKSAEAIAFVGAGASAGLYPLWSGLIEQLIDEARSRGLATDDECRFWRTRHTLRSASMTRLIKEKLGEGTYREILGQLFAPRAGEDGNPFTPLHAALIQLPFRGFVTTNFDSALLQAKQFLLKDIGGVGWSTWKDGIVNQWLTGKVFEVETKPILFAHGIYQRSDTIVLGIDEYREAYRPGPWRSCFERLWGQDTLVFVGFGFSDPWLDFLADEVITRTEARARAAPRHLALIGFKEEDGNLIEARRFFTDQYGSEVLFYPVTRGADHRDNHSVLQMILEEAARSVRTTASAFGSTAPVTVPEQPPGGTRSLDCQVSLGGDRDFREDANRRAENEKRLRKLKDRIIQALASSALVVSMLERRFGIEADRGGSTRPEHLSRAAHVTQALMTKSFLIAIPFLRTALDELNEEHDHVAIEAIKIASSLLVPWLYVASIQNPLAAGWESIEPDDIVILPAGISTFAEVVMAGLDRRPVDYGKDARKSKFPHGRHKVSAQPPGGIINPLDKNVRDDLRSKFELPSEFAGEEGEESIDRAINEEIADQFHRYGIQAYFICPDIPRDSLEQKEISAKIALIRQRYPSLAVVHLDLSLRHDHQHLFNQIADLMRLEGE